MHDLDGAIEELQSSARRPPVPPLDVARLRERVARRRVRRRAAAASLAAVIGVVAVMVSPLLRGLEPESVRADAGAEDPTTSEGGIVGRPAEQLPGPPDPAPMVDEPLASGRLPDVPRSVLAQLDGGLVSLAVSAGQLCLDVSDAGGAGSMCGDPAAMSELALMVVAADPGTGPRHLLAIGRGALTHLDVSFDDGTALTAPALRHPSVLQVSVFALGIPPGSSVRDVVGRGVDGYTARSTVEGVTDGAASIPDAPPRADHVDAEAMVSDFLLLADGPTIDAVGDLPFAEEVRLGLGSELHQTRSRAELADPAAWVIDVEWFRASSGPFSALELAAGARSTVVSVGEHPHCAGPPQPPPDDLVELARVSVQPDTTSRSCIEWWTVDLYVNDTGQIEAVTLDVWEP